MNFKYRSYQKELLDRDDIPFQEIKQNMLELDLINRFLGGHAITISGLKKILTNQDFMSKPVSICEVGCGGGDNLRAIYTWCKKNNIDCLLTGIDINPDCIRFAKERAGEMEVTWIASDFRHVSFDQQPHIIFNSLFCHHFDDQGLKEVLTWMKRNATVGFFISDLHRHPLAYYSIKMLTNFFSRSRLVKNDAPLSVLRGFSLEEWRKSITSVGIKEYDINWKWAFRWLIVAKTHG